MKQQCEQTLVCVRSFALILLFFWLLFQLSLFAHSFTKQFQSHLVHQSREVEGEREGRRDSHSIHGLIINCCLISDTSSSLASFGCSLYSSDSLSQLASLLVRHLFFGILFIFFVAFCIVLCRLFCFAQHIASDIWWGKEKRRKCGAKRALKTSVLKTFPLLS